MIFYSIDWRLVAAQAKYMTFMVSWWTVTALAMAAGPRSPSVPPEMFDWDPSEMLSVRTVLRLDQLYLLHCRTLSPPDDICF